MVAQATPNNAGGEGQGQGQQVQGTPTEGAGSKLWGDDSQQAGEGQSREGQQGGQAQGGEGGQAQGGEGQGQAGGEGQQQQAKPALSIDDIRAVATEIARANSAGVGGEQQKQLTPEEFDKMFNVVRPTKDQWAAIRGEDPDVALGALTDLLHGSVRQAVTLASFQLSQELAAIKQLVGPALQLAQKQELDGLRNEFFEKYQDLKGLEPLLMQIRDSFVSKGRNFPDKDAAFKAVADEAYAILSKIPGYQRGQPAGGQKGQQQKSNSMPSLSGKGQSGAGGGQPRADKKSAGMAVFD